MTKDEFKKELLERVGKYLATNELEKIEQTPKDEEFNILFDDFAYWMGQTYGV